MMAIKVLIYEDNNSLRNSIQTLLQWDTAFDVIAAMPDAICVQADVETLQPDVILMDIDMPQSNGVDAVKTIRKNFLDIPVVMFTVFEDDENIFNAIRSGANGYLLKKNFDQIPFALKDVLDGGAPMTSSVAKRVLNFIPKNNIKTNEEVESLSKREIEILEHITKGYSYKMIGEFLFIATETVRTHIKNIYKKLQVNSATEAVYKYNNSR
jgi:DNA-binding NarL/FixJ family response regulator